MKMKRKIKKVFLGIIGAFTLFLLKIKAFANMVSSIPLPQSQAAYGVYNTVGPIELTLRFLQRIAFPVILVLGVFVVGKLTYFLIGCRVILYVFGRILNVLGLGKLDTTVAVVFPPTKEACAAR